MRTLHSSRKGGSSPTIVSSVTADDAEFDRRQA
jgi:hypothetical protein